MPSCLVTGCASLLSGRPTVTLTRCPQIAAYWSMMPRDDKNENGAILVLDKLSLRSRYRIKPLHDVEWSGWPTLRNKEAEEVIWGEDICDLRTHLIGIVRVPCKTFGFRAIRRPV